VRPERCLCACVTVGSHAMQTAAQEQATGALCSANVPRCRPRGPTPPPLLRGAERPAVLLRRRSGFAPIKDARARLLQLSIALHEHSQRAELLPLPLVGEGRGEGGAVPFACVTSDELSSCQHRRKSQPAGHSAPRMSPGAGPGGRPLLLYFAKQSAPPSCSGNAQALRTQGNAGSSQGVTVPLADTVTEGRRRHGA
jgi:hypothetical protein